VPAATQLDCSVAEDIAVWKGSCSGFHLAMTRPSGRPGSGAVARLGRRSPAVWPADADLVESDTHSVQNVAQPEMDTPREVKIQTPEAVAVEEKTRQLASAGIVRVREYVTLTGLEPPVNSPENSTNPVLGGAENGALAHDADLAAIITAWPTLPEAIRAAILAMVRAASG